MIQLAMANAVVVVTITQANIFKPLRDRLPITPIINIRKLFHCAFCLSWWTSFAIASLLGNNVVLTALVLIMETSFFSWLLLLYMRELER
jgi:hypothetical protein